MKEPEDIIEAEFIVIENRGAQNTLECPRCGVQFEVDALTELNLVWNHRQMAFVAKCFLCGTQQK